MIFDGFFSGRMGPGGYPDDSVHSPQRHHPKSQGDAIVQRSPILVFAHQGRARGRPGLVHVPGEHRSDEKPTRISAGGR